MNKKVLVIAVALMAVAMLATPLVGMVQAKKTIVPFENVPVILQPTPGDVPVQKLSGDGHLVITTSQHYQAVYAGPLGLGMMYSDLIVSVMDNPALSPVGRGHGTYKYTLVIENGPYGKGTLSGHANGVYEFDFTVIPPRFEVWGKISLKQGTEDLVGVKMNFDVHSFAISETEILQLQTGEIILP